MLHYLRKEWKEAVARWLHVVLPMRRSTPTKTSCSGCFFRFVLVWLACAVPQTASLFALPRMSGQPKGKEESKSRASTSEQAVEFKLTVIGDGLWKDGTPFSVLQFSASDGGTVTERTTRCASKADAARKLETLIDGADHVAERGPKAGRGGKAVGERVLLIGKDSRGKKLVSVVWTEGLGLHQVSAYSLRDALAFERSAKNDPK